MVSGDTQIIENGGTATATVIMEDGMQIVNGGETENVSVSNSGMQTITAGTATGTVIMEGGKQAVSGGMATSTTIRAGGTQTVKYIGTAKDTTVSKGGVQEIIAGGTALNTTVKSGGTLNAYFGGANILGGSQIVEGGGLVSGGTLMTVSGVNAVMTVADGGMTISSQIGAGATQTVSSGGTVLDTTVEAGGTQTIKSGGIIGGQNTVSGTVSGGTLKRVWVYDVEKEAWTLRDAVQSIEDGGTAIGVTVVDNHATQQVGGKNAVASGTVVMSGGEQFVEKGGVANGTIVNAGGKQTIDEGGMVNHTSVNKGGTQSVVQGGTANDTIVNAGGTQNFGFVGISTNPDTGKEETIISAGGVANGTIVNEGGVQNIGFVTDDGLIAPGGIANGTILNAGGTQNVFSGGTADSTTLQSGLQSIASGGTAISTTLQNGLQSIASGGMAVSTTISGGTQSVAMGGTASYTALSGGTQTLAEGTADAPGGRSEHVTLAGGTLEVGDYATAQIDAATSGTLRLLETGLAEAILGGLDTSADTVFTITSAYARGDTVRLGLGDGNGYSAPGKQLNITNMDGYANFYVNTDLANSKSDVINITSAANASQANKIHINYDPTLAAGTAVAAPNVTVATVASGTATFEGAESTIGGYTYLPTISTTDNGLTWGITRVALVGTSEQMYAVLGNASTRAAAWRTAGIPSSNRLARLRTDGRTGGNLWLDFTRGRNSLDNQGRNVRATYSRMDIGYDHGVGKGWTVGLAYGLQRGSEGYTCGNGSTKNDIFTTYAMWQGSRNDYVELMLRAGRLSSKFDLQDPNQAIATHGNSHAYGQAASLVYGRRIRAAHDWYLEPHLGLQWAHVNGYGYTASDGSSVRVDGSQSVIGSLGLNADRPLGKGGTLYARLALLHDFDGHVRATMTRGASNTLENSFHDTWLDLALGYRQQIGPVGWYAEAGCQGMGSKSIWGNWLWRIGVNYSF